MATFTAWLTNPREDRGIHIAGPRDWGYTTYKELARSTFVVAARLAETGVQPGDVVCLTVPTNYESLAALFGVWVLGATVCPVPPPSIQPDHEYIKHASAILAHVVIER